MPELNYSHNIKDISRLQKNVFLCRPVIMAHKQSNAVLLVMKNPFED